MKKSLYLTETKHTLVYKILILLLFFSITSICVFQGVITFVDFLGLSVLEQKCTWAELPPIISELFLEAETLHWPK